MFYDPIPPERKREREKGGAGRKKRGGGRGRKLRACFPKKGSRVGNLPSLSIKGILQFME